MYKRLTHRARDADRTGDTRRPTNIRRLSPISRPPRDASTPLRAIHTRGASKSTGPYGPRCALRPLRPGIAREAWSPWFAVGSWHPIHPFDTNGAWADSEKVRALVLFNS